MFENLENVETSGKLWKGLKTEKNMEHLEDEWSHGENKGWVEIS